MPDTPNSVTSPPKVPPADWLAGGGETAAQRALKQRYPTALDLRERARRRLPRFAFEYLDGGAGSDMGIDRNWAAFDAIEMIPRYGWVVAPPPTDWQLFGRGYTAPFGIITHWRAGYRVPGC